MSKTANPCEHATAPINITQSSKSCKSICNYTYQYALSDCVLVNQGDYLQINTSKSGNNVQFNNAVYNLQEVRIYQPSLHTFNGGRAHAEIMIHHVGGGNNLLVCIPIKTANGASKSVDFFNSFIPYIPQRDGQSATVNVSNWSLNNVIPKGPYYFYRGTLPYPPCTGVYNIIV